MMNRIVIILCFIQLLSFSFCNNVKKGNVDAQKKDSTHSCMAIPPRFVTHDSVLNFSNTDTNTIGMVLIPGGDYNMGGDNNQASEDEYPKHKVRVD